MTAWQRVGAWLRCRIGRHLWYDSPFKPYPTPEGWTRTLVCRRCRRRVPWFEFRPLASSPFQRFTPEDWQRAADMRERSVGQHRGTAATDPVARPVTVPGYTPQSGATYSATGANAPVSVPPHGASL